MAPLVNTDDGIMLHVEETGTGQPIVFVHEFAGDSRSWEPQLRHFARRYRCISFNARGYPPSDVPADLQCYAQDRARDDILAVLDALSIGRAHIVGLSMGGFATLHFGLRYPDRARSLVVAGCGYGAAPDTRQRFQDEAEAMATAIEARGMAAVAAAYAAGPARVQFRDKDPRGWAEFASRLAEHDAAGAANTMRGVQKRRPSLYDLAESLCSLTLPTLIVTGDEDEPCLDVALFLKRTIPTSGLAILPKTGHTLNLEEPALFNQLCGEFFHQVEAGRWTSRVQPTAAAAPAILGIDP
jgi:pimeloyl-ACP methyl ester carboxylesterase